MKRESNFELLRILCMLSIVAGHFVEQSGIAASDTLFHQIFYCLMRSSNRIACSVFIMIGAWFGIDNSFKIRRVFHIWITVVMYTVPITLWCIYLGISNAHNFLFSAFFPINGAPLWFAGYYIILLLFQPMLNVLISTISKREYQFILLVFTILMVGYTTVTADLGFWSSDIWSFIYIC